MHKIKNKGTTVIVRRLGDLLLPRAPDAVRRRAGAAAVLRFAFVIVVRFRVCFAIVFLRRGERETRGRGDVIVL